MQLDLKQQGPARRHRVSLLRLHRKEALGWMRPPKGPPKVLVYARVALLEGIPGERPPASSSRHGSGGGSGTNASSASSSSNCTPFATSAE